MRRSFTFTAFLLLASVLISQAQTSQAVGTQMRAVSGLVPGAASSRFSLARIDRNIVKEFARAWEQVALGMKATEAVVLILRTPDGSYKAVNQGSPNQAYRFSFAWDPNTIAVVHTHPNNRDPEPHGGDIVVADRFGVPVLTITSKGMYMYDPTTKQITRVHKRLDWLKESGWKQRYY